jgi:N-acetylglutamate synthase-like GNAT family acetyltransferase
MLFREADPDDAAAVEALYRSFVRNPAICVLAERIAAIRADSNNFLVVAHDTRVIATALMTICLDAMFATAPYAVIENIVVADDARRRGVGRALLAHLDALARARACTKIMLLSSVERTDAHAFFQRAGFDGGRKRGFVKYLGYPPAAPSRQLG